MTTFASRRKDRLSVLLTRFGTWLRGSSTAESQTGAGIPDARRLEHAKTTALSPGAEQLREGVRGVQPATRAPIRDANRSTIDSEQYGGANLVTRIRPPSPEVGTQPSRATVKEAWVYPSSVDPTPVWYRVAGYEDTAARPQDEKPADEAEEPAA